MKYEEVPDYDKVENEKLLVSPVESEKIMALISLVYESGNYELSMQKSIEFAKSDSELIAANGIGCFGDIARIYKKLELDSVIEILKKNSKSENKFILGSVESAIDDITHFIKIDRKLFE